MWGRFLMHLTATATCSGLTIALLALCCITNAGAACASIGVMLGRRDEATMLGPHKSYSYGERIMGMLIIGAAIRVRIHNWQTRKARLVKLSTRASTCKKGGWDGDLIVDTLIFQLGIAVRCHP